jgi:hypothetical protein
MQKKELGAHQLIVVGMLRLSWREGVNTDEPGETGWNIKGLR